MKRMVLNLVFLVVGGHAFAQIVDHKGLVAEGAAIVKLGEGYSFTEGPIADKKGNVFFTDQPNNQIIKWNAKSGKREVFMSSAGRSNGMFFDKKGKLIACADEDNQLWSISKKGRVDVLIRGREGKLLNGPNDVWVHPNGDIYFTDPLYKRNYWTRQPESQQDGEHVYLFRPKSGELIVLNSGVVKPNGIIGSPDGKRLYVADIGDKKTYVYTIASDGFLINRALAAPMGSDGITLDEEENLYLTGDGVTVYNRDAQKIAHIPVRKGWTANVTFGGRDKKLLFITAGDAIFGLKMNVKGAY
jgi:gluconolactonase